MKISCIIPTYNEEPRIGVVLDAVTSCSLVDEIIVIDDCSTDNTSTLMSKYPRVTYIKLPVNQGKSKAVCHGIKSATGDIIFFLDADLMNLKSDNISDLLEPVISGYVDMSISLQDTYPTHDKISPKIGLDHLSGERAFHKKIIMPYLEEISRLPGFGLETFINKLIVKNKYSIQVVHWDNVLSPLKAYKYNLKGHFVDFKDYIKMWKAIFKVASPIEVIKNIIIMRRLRKFKNPTISLIIPAHNEEKYIEQCLENVLRYSEDKFLEIIVIDNASTDNTRKVVEKFEGVKVIFEGRKGVLHARERGFREAKGDIVAYIDADSYFMKGWPIIIENEFKKNKSLVCLSGICRYFDVPVWQKYLIWIYWYILAMPVYWILGYMMISGNFAIRKNVLEKMGGFDTSISFYGDDTNTARRASKFGKVKFRTDFFIHTSGRRLTNHGLTKVFYLYGMNFFSEVFFHKPHSKDSIDVR